MGSLHNLAQLAKCPIFSSSKIIPPFCTVHCKKITRSLQHRFFSVLYCRKVFQLDCLSRNMVTKIFFSVGFLCWSWVWYSIPFFLSILLKIFYQGIILAFFGSRGTGWDRQYGRKPKLNHYSKMFKKVLKVIFTVNVSYLIESLVLAHGRVQRILQCTWSWKEHKII